RHCRTRPTTIEPRARTAACAPARPPRPAPAPPIKADIERARVQLAAGNADQARRGAAQAVAAARGIGYRPLLADALLVEGHASMTNDRDAALARLEEATALALAAGSDAIAVGAGRRHAWLVGTGPAPEAALDGLAVIDVLATRAPSAFARALLHNNVGSIELARGHRDKALAVLERALDDARPVTGAGAIELIQIR